MAGYPPQQPYPQQPYPPPPYGQQPYPPQQGYPAGYQQPPPPQSGGGCFGCSMGCMVFLLVLLLLCGGAGLYVYYNWQVFLGARAREAVKEAVEKSGLDPADQQRVITQVNRVIEEFEKGKIGWERLGKMLEQLKDSPLLPVAIVAGFEAKYLAPSGLAEDEKLEARLTLQRVARGVFEGKINPDDLDDALEIVTEKDGEEKKFKDHITDDDLRKCLADLKSHADAAMVPEEEFKVDIPSELEKLVDKLLATPE